MKECFHKMVKLNFIFLSLLISSCHENFHLSENNSSNDFNQSEGTDSVEKPGIGLKADPKEEPAENEGPKSDPIDNQNVTVLSHGNCDDDTNRECIHLEIKCLDLNPRTVKLRYSPVDNAIGYVMTSTGTYGKGYYGDHDFPGINPIESLNKNNYATYEVNWQGGHGWASGNKGLGIKKMMCAYNELARWVHAQIPSSKPLCATGNSGGSLQISNTLVSPDYNTGENIFTHVVLTGGPPAQPDLNYYCDGFTDINNVDGVIKYTYNINEDNPWCQNMERPYKIEEFFKNDSLVRDDGIYNYNTSVSFIQGELDENVPDDALIYFNAITSEKSWTVLENTGHGVYKSKFGAPAIVNDLIDHCQ